MTGRMGRRCVLLVAISIGSAAWLAAQSTGAAASETRPVSVGAGGNAPSAAAAASTKAGDTNGVPLAVGTQSPVGGPVLLSPTEKRKALEKEADQLVAMATELKARVDLTNKNILSLTVVAQAEMIEHYAHQLKVGDAKK